MTNRRRVAFLGILALSSLTLWLSRGAAQTQEPKPEKKPEQKKEQKKKEKKPRATRVLFIGGSFIYDNNLPDIFARLALAGGAGTVETGMVALPGWSLKDHWQKGDAHDILRKTNWNFVVLQDQSLLGAVASPGGQPAGAVVDSFRPFARNWAQVVQDVRAVPVFFLTWARKDAPDGQTFLNSAFFDVAKEVEAKVAGVGIAWAQVQKAHPEIDLYTPDGVDPSPAGTYLAACTIFATMFGRNPEGVPAKFGGRPVNRETGKVESETPQILIDLPPAEAKVLQQAAWAAKKLLDKNHGYLDVSAPK